MIQKISHVIVETLRSAGVRDIFGIPSIHNIGFYEALRQEPSIRHFLCRHEASATQMADGYARSGKGVGVVVTSTGPGALYTISPLLEAHDSCSPVLMITTNLRSKQLEQGLGLLHEVAHQDAMFSSVTKETICLTPESDIKSEVERAISLAVSGRPGPVYLEVPTDLWDLEIEVEQKIDTAEPLTFDQEHLDKAVNMLVHAKQPMIIAGIEAVITGLEKEVKTLAELLQAPVLTDTGGKGILSEDHPLAFGHVAARWAVNEFHNTCDVTLSLGSRLRYVDFKRRGISLPGLIHMDWDSSWIDKNFKAEIRLTGDVKTLAGLLAKRLKNQKIQENRKKTVLEYKEKQRQYFIDMPRGEKEIAFMNALRDAIPERGMLVVDNTILGYLAQQLYSSKRPLGIVSASGSAPIGFAFPAALGLKIANASEPVVALIGDGGFLYGSQELATCMQNNIGFPVIVVNDKSYRMIDILQHNYYQAGYQTTLYNPDFTAYAKSFGAMAVSVSTPDNLNQAIKEALKSGKMWLIELNTSFPDSPFGRY